MSEIVVYAEITDKGLNPETAELITTAEGISAVSGEPITVLAADESAAEYARALSLQGVSRVILVKTPGITCANGDALADVLTAQLRALDPSVVLVPASHTARALFSRVAVQLDTGMTAACFRLETELVEGKPVIHQIKSSFGSQAYVTCDITTTPAIITMIPESCEPETAAGEPQVEVTLQEGLSSAIEFLGTEEDETESSLMGADFVVCVGKGALEGDGLALAKEYAAQEGAALAGSRPMSDQGYIPFESQVGESGTIIRPDVCLIFGVSGAIQFTEGIKGDPLVIAVNSDPKAPIFNFAQYMAVADMGEVLRELLKK